MAGGAPSDFLVKEKFRTQPTRLLREKKDAMIHNKTKHTLNSTQSSFLSLSGFVAGMFTLGSAHKIDALFTVSRRTQGADGTLRPL